MKPLLSLMRPQQWSKNVFVFAPLFFSGGFVDGRMFVNVVVAAFSLCLAASAVYCFNDVCDSDADKLHPVKRNRPIASGKITKRQGVLTSVCLLVISFVLLLFTGGVNKIGLLLYTILYVVINIAYCVYLKHKALIDVFIIALGFVIRVLIGGVAANIWISHWLVLMTFLLALFLALAKRRDDVVIFERTGQRMRRNTNRYNVEFMNQSITIVATIVLICYILYSVSPEVVERLGCDYVYITSFFVLLGIMRYLQLTIVDVKSGSPTYVLLHDRFVQMCVCGWIISFAFIIYL